MSTSKTKIATTPAVEARTAKGAHDDVYGKLYDAYGKPFKVPQYTLKELLDVIPTHCFERSPFTGFQYLAQDIALISLTFYAAYTYVTPALVPSWWARFALWTLYGILQGFFGTGVWVIAHECNHQAFSKYKTLNDTVGWIFHSALLVPYFSWKIVHKQHHSLHNNLAKDLQFVPRNREGFAKEMGKEEHSNWEITEDTPLHSVLSLLGQQVFGWPYYLLTNVSSAEAYQKRSDGRGVGKHNGWGGGVNHFVPSSPLFNENDKYLILLSDLGIAITLSTVLYLGYRFGWVNILVWYWIPYFWVNNWLVAIAYLHHTDPALPHYQPEAWNYVRGAAATIDRDFGFIGHYFLHDIIETHVLHHTVPTIPFYHAREATEAIKTVMGEHYRSDVKGGSIGFLQSMWKCVRWCQWMEPCETAVGEGKAVWFFRNSNHLGVPPMKALGKER